MVRCNVCIIIHYGYERLSMVHIYIYLSMHSNRSITVCIIILCGD